MFIIDNLIYNIKNKQSSLESREDFDYYQGVLDLLNIARRNYLHNIESKNAQIFHGRSEDTIQAS